MLCIQKMIASHVRVLTCVCFIWIGFHVIEGGILSGVLDTVGNDVGDLVNGITGDSETTQFCRMNSVISSVAQMV